MAASFEAFILASSDLAFFALLLWFSSHTLAVAAVLLLDLFFTFPLSMPLAVSSMEAVVSFFLTFSFSPLTSVPFTLFFDLEFFLLSSSFFLLPLLTFHGFANSPCVPEFSLWAFSFVVH